jgi:hypothetical protein
MVKCDICGKEFPTTQALGSHKRYNHALVPALSDSHPRVSDSRNIALARPSESRLRVSESQSPVLRRAETVAKRYSATGLRFDQLNWGKLLPAIAIGIFVAWLVYKALDSWEWKGSPKKQISPYKLLGGLISGLG